MVLMLFRKTIALSMALTLGLTLVSCGGPALNTSPNSPPQSEQTRPQPIANRLSDGQYPVQQATYNDATGEYEMMLLNTRPGESPNYRVENLPMARLTDQEIAAGQTSYLKLENGQPSLHLTENFRIEYVHNVTNEQVNPQTGQTETVVVRQETGFWAPFAGAIAGQALGSLLFRPQYYVPPAFQPGGMVGYGGYGQTYDRAVSRYQQRYNAPPAAVRNRQVFRTAGGLRRSPGYPQPGQSSRRTNQPSGSGYGSSTLRRSNGSRRPTVNRSRPGNRGFGSARPRSGFGSRRR